MRRGFERILAMQTGGWIGDMVLLTPALRALKRRYPRSHLALLVNPLVERLMMRNPYVDEVIVYDKRGKDRGLKGFIEMAARLRKRRFDLALIFHPNSVRSALLALAAGVPERVGSNASMRGLLLTRSIPDEKWIHEVERYLRVTRLAGAEGEGRLEFWHGEEERRYIRRLLKEEGIDPGKPLVAVNPFTTWPSKRWEAGRFAELIRRLKADLGVQVVLTGSEEDLEEAERIASLSRAHPLILAGRTDVFQLGALLEICDLLITPDSAPMHIAAAVGTPTVALFGPTSPLRHGPYGEGHTVLHHPPPCSPCYNTYCRDRKCMLSITVDEVLEAVRRALG
mgnify:CR=1 FL=1